MLDPIELAAENPFGRMARVASDPSGGTIAIAAPGAIDTVEDANTNGVEIITLETGARELAISEDALGGSPIEVVVAGPSEAYAIVAGPVPGINPTSVVAFDPSQHVVTRTFAGPADGFVHSGLALNGPYLVVGDRTFGAPAIRFFERASGKEAFSIAPKLLPPIGALTLDP